MLKTLSKFSLAFLFIATLVAQSCSKSVVEEIVTEETTAVPANVTELKQFLARTTGATVEKIIYTATSNSFTIDGDVTMTLEEATEHYNFEASGTELPTGTSAITQRKSFYTIARSKATTITLYADASVPAVWVTALDQAIANWNNTNSLLKISRTTSTTAKIKVSTKYEATGVVATAVYPDYNGNPGKSIVINTYHNSMDASQKLFAITHELGHNFGLSHTDGTYGNIVSGTPTSDPNSVMNSRVLSWTSFTAYDLKAVQTIYPR